MANGIEYGMGIELEDDIVGFGFLFRGHLRADPSQRYSLFHGDEWENMMESMRRHSLDAAKRYWPVDTGRSLFGLWNRVADYLILWFNRHAYAYWVEVRWFPLDRFFSPSRMRELAAKVQADTWPAYRRFRGLF